MPKNYRMTQKQRKTIHIQLVFYIPIMKYLLSKNTERILELGLKTAAGKSVQYQMGDIRYQSKALWDKLEKENFFHLGN